MNALVVDDSSIIRTAISQHLEKAGHKVVAWAGDGLEAMKMFLLHRPDVVTLDITMPHMDGLSCLEQMLDLRPDCSIVVISALKDSGTGIKALSLGAKAFLTKPFRPAELLEELDRSVLHDVA